MNTSMDETSTQRRYERADELWMTLIAESGDVGVTKSEFMATLHEAGLFRPTWSEASRHAFANNSISRCDVKLAEAGRSMVTRPGGRYVLTTDSFEAYHKRLKSSRRLLRLLRRLVAVAAAEARQFGSDSEQLAIETLTNSLMAAEHQLNSVTRVKAFSGRRRRSRRAIASQQQML